MTYPTSPPSQEVTCIITTEEAESLPACQPSTKDEPLREAATVCKGDVARLGHKMAAETSAVKTAESLTEKDTLHTDPSLEENGERQAIKAQQELSFPGKDMLVSSTEDMKENRVEVGETHQQMGDGKTSDHMLHSGPECGKETPHQTLVQPETPGLPDPESQTPELQEDEMLANVTDEAEPVKEVTEDKESVLEEEKMTVGEELMPFADEEIRTVVSDAAEMPPDAILNGTSTEEYNTHQLMVCVEGSPPKEDSNEQSNKEPTKEEENNKESTEEAVAPEIDQQRSKKGHSSPVTKPPSTRRSTRRSAHTTKVEVEDADYQILDSVEEDPSSTRGGRSPPSGAVMSQGQPHPEDEDEGEYQVVDSVEGEVVEDKEVQLPTRRPTTRGKRGKPPKRTTKNIGVKKEQATAPVREETGEKPHEPVENQASPTRTETQRQEAPEPTYHIIDSVEGESNMEEPTIKEEESRGKEGGAGGVKMVDKATPSDAKPRESGEGVTLEEVATYQVLDSVEEEEVKEVPPVMKGTRGRGRKGGRGQKAARLQVRKDYKLSVEETMFEVLDAIGGDAVEEVPAAEDLGRPQRGQKKDPTPARDGKDQGKKGEEVAPPIMDSEKQESPVDEQTATGKRRSGRRRKEEVVVSGTSKTTTKEGQQMVQHLDEEVYQVVDFIEDEPHEEEEHVNSSGPRRRSSRRRDTATAKTRVTRTSAKSTQGEEPIYQVVDSVGGEEEQVPEEKQLPKEPVRGKRGCEVTRRDAKTEEKATKKKKTTEQNVPTEGDEDGGEEKLTDAGEKGRQEENVLVSLDEVSEEEEDYPDDSVQEEELRKRQAVPEEEERRGEEEEEVGAEMEGLVTLDEVGEEKEEEDGRGGEEESGRIEWGITEGELQALVTLDEVLEEEQEGEEPMLAEPLPLLPDDQSQARMDAEVREY